MVAGAKLRALLAVLALHVGRVVPAEQIVEAQWTSERRGRERFRCEQPPYSILARGIERSVLPTCARYGMGVIVWSPLNGGWLSGKYRRGQAWPEGSRGAMGMFSAPEKKHNQRKFDAVDYETRHGAPVLTDALAWLVCELRELRPGGDHEIGIGAVVAMDRADGEPLVWYRGGYTTVAPDG